MNVTEVEREFNRFILTIPNAEVVDNLNIRKHEGLKVADYFFNNRRIIGELKCFEVDTGRKLQELVDKLVEKEKIVFYGQLPFNEVISKLSPNLRVSLEKEAFELVSTSLEGAYEEANRQIRDTKSNLKLSNSSGFLILLNNSNLALDPKIAIYKLNQLMNKRKNNGARYESLNFGIYISTKHYNVNRHEKFYPHFTFINNNLRNLNTEEEIFIRQFQECYSKLKNIPIYFPEDLKIKDAIELPFRVD